jgi:hypothetical protein
MSSSLFCPQAKRDNASSINNKYLTCYLFMPHNVSIWQVGQ